MQLIGLQKSQFAVNQRRGLYRHLEVKRPIGLRRYSKALVALHVNGSSTVALGRGSQR